MKILLVTQVPPYYELSRESEADFPEFQSQFFWVKALKALDHKVLIFKYSDPVLGPRKFWAKTSRTTEILATNYFKKYRLARNKFYKVFPDNGIRSQKLSYQIKTNKPDLILLSGGISDLSGQELVLAKKLKIPVVLLHGVQPETGATNYEKDFIHLFDHIITNDYSHAESWLSLGARRATALPYAGVDSEYHRDLKLPRTEQLIFIGTLFEERQQLFRQLLKKQIKPILYGYIPRHLKLLPELRKYYRGEAWGNQMITLYNQAQMALNLVPQHMPIGGNMRTFEIPACNTLQVASRCPKEWYVPDKEIILFDSLDQLVEKVSYYLVHENERQAITRRAFHKTHNHYTYKNRFRDLLALI